MVVAAAGYAVTSVVGEILKMVHKTYVKVPYHWHDSALSGAQWTREVMKGHPDRIRTEFGVSLDVFHQLLEDLMHMGYAHSRYISLQEQLAIFLYTCTTGLSRRVGERFQHSNGTINQYAIIDFLERTF